jgi:DNA-binding NarL/FixJ family response regulator
MIRIILVEDHTMIRQALRSVLESKGNIQVVAEVGDGESALQRVDELAPDLVVMDVDLPGESGIEITQRLHARHPDIKVLALSTHHDGDIIKQMFVAGASGYIVKSAAGDELVQGIQSVLAGRSFLCPESTALVMDSLQEGPAEPVPAKPDHSSLSRRELQIATLLADGKSVPDIATELHISPRTVDVHRTNLMRKLGLHSVVELTKYALRSGLIST